MLKDRVSIIEKLFNSMDGVQASNWQVQEVAAWRKANPELNEDLDFCFEVLAGKHKIGMTIRLISQLNGRPLNPDVLNKLNNLTIKEYYTNIKNNVAILGTGYVQQMYEEDCMLELGILDFMKPLINREYRLGYSNKQAMITDLSPMLAKKYPDDHVAKEYYIQEKLDGNRCIAYYNNGKWNFQSRSGKVLKVDFDMSWAPEDLVFDGEVMTLGKAGSRDFNKTSGAINGKYTDKSALHYYIYDIIDTSLTYEERWAILKEIDDTKDCTILPVLGKVFVDWNPSKNQELDKLLDYIVDKGGEGVMLRDPNGTYEHKRSKNLLKYKKVKTMDLRVTGVLPGTGKYIGMIGSLECQDDEHTILVNVGSGLSDEDRMLSDEFWLNKIVEVKYFDVCQSDKKDVKSLRFPRLKGIREDKNETSKY